MQDQYDVIIMGSGIAGMAAGIHLRRAGMTVVCVEDTPGERNAVGESLDWSAPALLKALGLPMDTLLHNGIATLKRHVTLKLRDASQHEYVPGEWLSRPPYNVQLDTLHVDRPGLDGVDGDLIRTELAGQALREGRQRGLRQSVYRKASTARYFVCKKAADVDDATALS